MLLLSLHLKPAAVDRFVIRTVKDPRGGSAAGDRMLLMRSGLVKGSSCVVVQLWIAIGKCRPGDEIRHFQANFRALLVIPTLTAFS